MSLRKFRRLTKRKQSLTFPQSLRGGLVRRGNLSSRHCERSEAISDINPQRLPRHKCLAVTPNRHCERSEAISNKNAIRLLRHYAPRNDMYCLCERSEAISDINPQRLPRHKCLAVTENIKTFFKHGVG